MTLFKSLRANTINSQIVFAFFTLTTLIIALEVLAYVWINETVTINRLKESSARLKELQMQMKSASNEFILREKANEKFFASGKSVYLNRYAGFLKQLNEEIDVIQGSTSSLQSLGETGLDSLKQAVKIHSKIFEEMVAKLKTRGYGRYGLIGEFDKSIAALLKYDFGSDNQAVLNLQLFVKNYLLTGDENLIDNISNEIFNFTMALEGHIRDEEVEKVSNILIEYETVFKQLTVIDAELGIYSGGGLQAKLFDAIDQLDQASELKGINASISKAYDNNLFKLYLSFFLVVGVALVTAIIINRRLFRLLVQPIHRMKTIIADMSKGRVPQADTRFQVDDLNEMAIALNGLVIGIRNYQEFADSIGKGNLDKQFTPLSDDDILGTALLTMRQNLKTSSEEDRKRVWTSQGLAELSALLRTKKQNAADHYNLLLQYVVKYAGCNQGTLFLTAHDTDTNDDFLDMVACYAWEKRKYTTKRIPAGNGIIGQCILDKQPIYMTDIPENYISITSGLGEGNPKSLLLVPLISDDHALGVLELASFKKFEPYQIEFQKKVAEMIAGFVNVEFNTNSHKNGTNGHSWQNGHDPNRMAMKLNGKVRERIGVHEPQPAQT